MDLSAWEEDRVPGFLATFFLFLFAGPGLVGMVLGVFSVILGAPIDALIAMIPISYISFYALFGAGAAGFNLLLSVLGSALIYRTALKFAARAMFENVPMRRYELTIFVVIGGVSIVVIA